MAAESRSIKSKTLLQNSIRVGTVAGGRKTDSRRMSNIGNVGLRKAIENSLLRSGIYSPSGNLRLDVQLCDEVTSVDYFEFEAYATDSYGKWETRTVKRRCPVKTTINARYIVRDIRSGEEIFNEVIKSINEVPREYNSSLPQGVAFRLIKEQAMKENIELFLSALDKTLAERESPIKDNL